MRLHIGKLGEIYCFAPKLCYTSSTQFRFRNCNPTEQTSSVTQTQQYSTTHNRNFQKMIPKNSLQWYNITFFLSGPGLIVNLRGLSRTWTRRLKTTAAIRIDGGSNRSSLEAQPTKLFPLPRRKYRTPCRSTSHLRHHCRPSNGDWKLNCLSAAIHPSVSNNQKLSCYGFALHCAVTWPWSFFVLRHDSFLSFLLTYLLIWQFVTSTCCLLDMLHLCWFFRLHHSTWTLYPMFTIGCHLTSSLLIPLKLNYLSSAFHNNSRSLEVYLIMYHLLLLSDSGKKSISQKA